MSISSLRLERGLCYSVDVRATRVDQDLATLDVILDPVAALTGETVVAAVTLLRTIVDRGFSSAAIEGVHQSVAMTRLDPSELTRMRLEELVAERLLGYSSGDVDDDLVRGEAVTSRQLSETLRDSLDSLIVMYDEDAEVDDLAALTGIGVDELEPISPISRAEFRSRSRSSPGSQRWRSHVVPAWSRSWATVDNGVLLCIGRTGGWAIDLATAALVGRRSTEGVVMILGPDGRRFSVATRGWWRGSSLLDAIVEAAPSDRVRDFPA